MALVAALVLLPAVPASAGSGGTGTGDDGGGDNCVNKRSAKLDNGKAIVPCDAPRRIKRVIRAANEIAKGTGYCWGGGHKANCYDCSGAVSYALRGGNFVEGSRPSTGYYTWGRKGRGKWLTVFTSSGHMYMTVAGLRFDTSMTPGAGPGWSSKMRDGSPFRKRHKRGF